MNANLSSRIIIIYKPHCFSLFLPLQIHCQVIPLQYMPLTSTSRHSVTSLMGCDGLPGIRCKRTIGREFKNSHLLIRFQIHTTNLKRAVLITFPLPKKCHIYFCDSPSIKGPYSPNPSLPVSQCGK